MATVSKEIFFKKAIRMIAPSLISRKMKEYRYRSRAKKLIQKTNDFPESLNLSLSAICQAKCIYCPSDRGKGIKPPFMSSQLAKKAADEAKKENFQGTVRFSENGEALLNKDFFSIYEYCRKMLPTCRFVLYTNMALLNKSTSLRLLANKLDELHFNVDGASAVTYEASKKLNFATFKQNLHDFIEARKKLRATCKIHIYILTAKKYMAVVEQTNISLPDDTKKIIENWEPLLEKSDIISVVDKPYKWALREKNRLHKTSPCRKLSKVIRECLIGPNGDVYICCLDYQQKCVIGNVNDNSIKEIWSSPRRRTLLKLLGKLRFDEIGEPCAFCLD